MSSSRSQESETQRGRRLRGGRLELDELLLELELNLMTVVEVVRQSSMDLAREQVWILTNDLVGRPTVTEMVRNDLRNANPRPPRQAGGPIGGLLDVGVGITVHFAMVPREPSKRHGDRCTR